MDQTAREELVSESTPQGETRMASTSSAGQGTALSEAAENGQQSSESADVAQERPAADTAAGTAETTLSKSQQRKLARKERLAATKPERRAREKAAKKERLAEKRRLVEEEGADPYEIGLAKKKKPRKGERFNANVVIDLGFDNKMSEKDIKSMSTQLAHVYNVNRNAVNSVNVIFTPLEGQLKQRMVEGRKGDYLRWKGLQVYEKPIEELWSDRKASTVANTEAAPRDADDKPASPGGSDVHGQNEASGCLVHKEDVTYLTADSKNVLESLEVGKTYIIGGIVDHNRYKNLCLGIAQEHGINHAALPISQYIDLASRKVLTVNQCFEIMSKWLEYRDWEKAFFEVIPKRKFDKGKDSNDNSPFAAHSDQESEGDIESTEKHDNPEEREPDYQATEVKT